MISNFKITFCAVFLFLASCSEESEYQNILTSEENEQYSGGVGTTIFNTSQEAFGFFIPTITPNEQTDFGIGNSFFRQTWVSAPASTTARDGLGPFYNGTACSSCHFKDGRGRAPNYEGEFGTGLLLRLSLLDKDANGQYLPDPIYGNQLQDVAILGQKPEATYEINYAYFKETYQDGSQIELRKPTYVIKNLNYGALALNTRISPRVASQMVGMGLLEAISEEAILKNQDITDSDNNGISGKANYVYDTETNTIKLGRFGWKANQPTIKQQVAAAFSGDIGLTSSLFPSENSPAGHDISNIPNGGNPEVTDRILNKVVIYTQTLAVPARRNYNDSDVLEGKQLFNTLNCIACHTDTFETSANYPIVALRNLTIRPYTDLLLHDMGEGLADNAPDFLATGTEWRTPPLWGIGLIPTVNNHTFLLHDGRARNIEEAILWHGGEAETSKENFKALKLSDRKKVLAFLNSL